MLLTAGAPRRIFESIVAGLVVAAIGAVAVYAWRHYVRRTSS